MWSHAKKRAPASKPKLSFCRISKEAAAAIAGAVRSGDYAPAKTAIIKDIERKPKCAPLWLNLGNVYYLSQDFVRSAASYERALQVDSAVAPLAKFYLGKSQRKQGKLVEALLTFSQIPKRVPAALAEQVKSETQDTYAENLNEALKDLSARRYEKAEQRIIANLNIDQNPYLYAALAIALQQQDKWDRERTTLEYGRQYSLNEVERRIFQTLENQMPMYARPQLPQTLFIRMDLATGYDSNVMRVAEDSARHESQTFRAFAELEKIISNGERYQSSVRAGFTYDDYFKLPKERYSTFYALQRNVFRRSGWTFDLSPQVSFELYDNRPYWLRPGVYSEVGTSIGANNVGLVYEYWRNLRQSKVYKAIDGDSHYLSGYFTRNFTDDFIGTFSYSASRFAMDDDEAPGFYRVPQTYLSHGPLVRLIWTFLPSWTIRIGYEFLTRNYSRTFLPEDQERVDKTKNLSAKLSVRADETLVLYIQGQNQVRTSTMGPTSARDGNWKASSMFAGFSWDVF